MSTQDWGPTMPLGKLLKGYLQCHEDLTILIFPYNATIIMFIQVMIKLRACASRYGCF